MFKCLVDHIKFLDYITKMKKQISRKNLGHFF